MKTYDHLRVATLTCILTGLMALGAVANLAGAASPTISDVPLAAAKRPNPNIVMSYDDSGSMDFEVGNNVAEGVFWWNLEEGRFHQWGAGPILRTPDLGADTIVWLAAAREAARSTGRFWCDRRIRPTHFLPWQHDDPSARQQLWDTCCSATGAVVGERSGRSNGRSAGAVGVRWQPVAGKDGRAASGSQTGAGTAGPLLGVLSTAASALYTGLKGILGT